MSHRLKNCADSDPEEIIFETKRLALRRLNPANDSDVAFIQQLLTTPEWTENICPMPHVAADIEEARKYIVDRPLRMYAACGVGSLLAILKSDDDDVAAGRCGGLCGTRVGIGGLILREELDGLYDLGFALLPQFFRRGFGEELSRGVLKWAQDELQLTHVAAITRDTNVAAQALLKKLGFVQRPGQLPVWYGAPQVVMDWHPATATTL